MNEENTHYGHKTYEDEDGNLHHEPLTKQEYYAAWDAIGKEDKMRKEKMPTEESAIKALFHAYERLKDFGYNDAVYCPKDGSTFETLEAGSTRAFKCTYDGEWPKGTYWAQSDGDIFPSRPILWRPLR